MKNSIPGPRSLQTRLPRVARPFGTKAALILAFIALSLTSCSAGRTYVVGGVIQDVVEASQSQDDLQVIRQGIPSYLMLIDGMIHAEPTNKALLIAGARAYTTYATLVEDQESSRRLYTRAKDYALTALNLNEHLGKCSQLPLDEFRACLVENTDAKDVPLLYWSAVVWGGWISTHLDDIIAVSQLPRVEALMRRAVALDETYGRGGGLLFLGTYEASRPGGNLAEARRYFERGLKIGEGRLLMGYVYFASSYAVKARDRKAYHEALEKVIKTPADIAPDLTLVNTIAKNKAQGMLDEENDIFLE